MIFEELLVLQLGLLRMKSRKRGESPLRLTKDCTEEFYRLLPFTPTNAQKRAVREAMADMMGGSPMNAWCRGRGLRQDRRGRCAVLQCDRKWYAAALMAPTEILARQHYTTLSAILAPAGIPIALLTGSLPLAKRKSWRNSSNPVRSAW